jgi:hypothetical protein
VALCKGERARGSAMILTVVILKAIIVAIVLAIGAT